MTLGYQLFFEIVDVWRFSLINHDYGSTLLALPSSPPDSMDVEVRVLRQVDLDYRVDFFEVDTSSDHITREEKPSLFLAELGEDIQPLLLFYLAVNLAQVVAFEDLVPVADVPLEELEVEVDRVAGVKEDDDLLVFVFDYVLSEEDDFVQALVDLQIVVVQSDWYFVFVAPLIVCFLVRTRLLSVSR